MNPKLKEIGRIRADVLWPLVAVFLLAAYFGQTFAAGALRSLGTPGGQEDLGALERAALVALRDVLSLLFWAILIPAGILLVVQLAGWALRHFPSLFDVAVDEEQPPAKREVETLPPVIRGQVLDVERAMEAMRQQIAKVMRRRNDAAGQLVEIETAAELMARMVISSAERADYLEKMKARVKGVLVALGDGVVPPSNGGVVSLAAIAELAGELGDPSLATLVCSPFRPRYNGPLAEALGRYAGALQNQVDILDRLNRTWLMQIGECREQILILQGTIQAVDTLPVVIRIRGHLDTAHQALGLDMRAITSATVTGQIYLPNDPDVIDE